MKQQYSADYMREQREQVLREAAGENLGRLLREHLRSDNAICLTFDRGTKYMAPPKDANMDGSRL